MSYRNSFRIRYKSWELTIYDKTLEMEQKPQPQSKKARRNGRFLRIEWRLKNKAQIEKRLGLQTPAEILDSLEDSRDLEWALNEELKKSYRKQLPPYGQRLPKFDLPVMESFQLQLEASLSKRERDIFEYLKQDEPLRRDDLDWFVLAVGRLGPNTERVLLREIYGMDGVNDERRYDAYDKCREKLRRLRQMSVWSIEMTWKEREKQIWFNIIVR